VLGLVGLRTAKLFGRRKPVAIAALVLAALSVLPSVGWFLVGWLFESFSERF
jgi:hypothetical protein